MELSKVLSMLRLEEDIPSLNHVFLKYAAHLGYKDCAYVRFFPEMTILHKSGVDQSILKYYSLYLDLVRSACQRSREPFFWSEITQMPWVRRDQRKRLEGICKHGPYGDLIVPLHGPCGEFAAVAFASSRDRAGTSHETLHLLLLSCIQFHISHSALRQEVVDTDLITLTPREEEIMQWCMMGKSRPVIAMLVNSAEKTVEWHLGRIYRKLGTSCRVTSVVKAMQLGLIGSVLYAPVT